MHFRQWVLTYAQFRDRVATLRKIAVEFALSVPDGLFADLERLSAVRNDLAHSSVVVNPKVPRPEGRKPDDTGCGARAGPVATRMRST